MCKKTTNISKFQSGAAAICDFSIKTKPVKVRVKRTDLSSCGGLILLKELFAPTRFMLHNSVFY